jgi:hypothetical protein
MNGELQDEHQRKRVETQRNEARPRVDEKLYRSKNDGAKKVKLSLSLRCTTTPDGSPLRGPMSSFSNVARSCIRMQQGDRVCD